MGSFETTNALTLLTQRSAEVNNDYRALQVKSFPRRPLAETAEEKYWKGFKKRTEVPAQFRGRVSCIDFSPRAPHTCAVTGQGQVMLFNTRTHELEKSVNPTDTVYCTRWRPDGKLLVTSGEQTGIRLWNLGGMKMLRELPGDPEGIKGHRRAVHSVNFLSDRKKIVSGGDDGLVLVWDIGAQQAVHRMAQHTDYVRATTVHPHNPSLFASGSHDKTVRLHDLRAPAQAVRTWTLADPVAAVLFHPTGGYLAAASSSEATLWDCGGDGGAGGAHAGLPLATLGGHTKDVTSLAFNYYGSRLLTGGADRHVKIYETQDFTAVHSISFSEPVFSVGLSPDGRCLAAGGLDGKVFLRSREGVAREGDVAADGDNAYAEEEAAAEVKELEMYSGRGDMTRERRRNWHAPVFKSEAHEGDAVVEERRERKLRRFDVAFRKFNYHKAMDEALALLEKNSSNRVAVFCTVVGELHRRNGLRIALAGRDSDSVLLIIKILKEGLFDPRYTDTLSLVLHLLLEIYHSVLHEASDVMFRLRILSKKLEEHLHHLGMFEEVLGTIGSLMTRSKLAQLRRARAVDGDAADEDDDDDADGAPAAAEVEMEDAANGGSDAEAQDDDSDSVDIQ